eukprot:5865-Heterococcus_DN1.PRE.5
MSSPLLHNELPTESNSGLGSVAPPTLSPLRPCDVKTSDLDAYAPAETKGETEDRLDTTTETKISAHSVPHLDSNAEQQKNSHNEPSAPSVYELSDQLQAASIDGAAPAAASGESSAATTSTTADAPPLQRAQSVNRKFAEADFDSLHEDEEQSAASTAADTTSEPSASSGITADKPTLRLTGHVIEFFDGRPIEVIAGEEQYMYHKKNCTPQRALQLKHLFTEGDCNVVLQALSLCVTVVAYALLYSNAQTLSVVTRDIPASLTAGTASVSSDASTLTLHVVLRCAIKQDNVELGDYGIGEHEFAFEASEIPDGMLQRGNFTSEVTYSDAAGNKLVQFTQKFAIVKPNKKIGHLSCDCYVKN